MLVGIFIEIAFTTMGIITSFKEIETTSYHVIRLNWRDFGTNVKLALFTALDIEGGILLVLERRLL